MSNIAKTLKIERLSKGMTQKSVADYLGVASTTYSSWEQEKSEPSIDMILQLANLFEITTDELLCAYLTEVIVRPELRPQVKNITQKVDLLNDIGLALVVGYVSRLLEQNELVRG